MNKFLTLMFLSFFNSSSPVILISLGGDCTVAGVQRDLGLRKAAYPFDWMFSSFDAVYRAIQDDFKFFLSPESLKIDDNNNRIILDYYHLGFVHDFPTINNPAAVQETQSHEWAKIADNWRDYIPQIKEKYQRRIERFRNALNSEDQVFLIRYAMSKDEAIKIRDLMSKLYPNAIFTIVAISGKMESDVDWNLEKIRNFWVVYESKDFWQRWKNIYNSLGVNINNVRSVLPDEDDDICDKSYNWRIFRKSSNF